MSPVSYTHLDVYKRQVLMDDVTYNSSNITIGRGIVNLCLNGHKFDMGLNGITVESGAELHIYDCSDPSSGQIVSTRLSLIHI